MSFYERSGLKVVRVFLRMDSLVEYIGRKLGPRLRSATGRLEFIGHNKSEKQLVQTFHRKTDSLAVDIHFQHFHLDVLLKLDNRGRV